jgi:outer membrane protein assembly factor BamB
MACCARDADGWTVMATFGQVFGLQKGQLQWHQNLRGQRYGEMTCMFEGRDALIVGGNGYVNKLDLTSGKIMHKYAFPSLLGFYPVAMLRSSDGKSVYCASYGTCVALNINDLSLVWENNLPGLGYQMNHSLTQNKDYLFDGCGGKVVKLNKSNGEIVWVCKGSAFWATTSSMLVGGVVFMGANGHVYGYSADSGEKVLEDNLAGLKYGTINLATPSGQWTDNNSSCPLLQGITRQRKNNNNNAKL